jgi:type I restriction enzyme S subunit
VDDKIDLLSRQNKTLEALAETLFRQWFVEEAEESLGIGKLGDFVTTTSGGTPSRSNIEFYSEGNIDWVKSKELSGSFLFETEERITEEAVKHSSAKILPANSILIAMYGATVGEYAILANQATCNQAICALIPNEQYPYTFLFLFTKANKEDLINLAVGSAQQNISQVLIKQLEIPLPSERIIELHNQVKFYLSAKYTLSRFTPTEREQFDAQFNGLSEQEREDITSRVVKKTNPNFFHLTDEEVEKLKAARKDMSFHERARLLSNLILTAAGTAWLDLGNIFEASIEIDDSSSPDRWKQPYAYIYFPKSLSGRVETVDILKSVRTNPTCIGHPVIVFAIYHWQRVIYTKRVLERDDVTYRGEIGESFKLIFGGQEVENALKNLEAISKALFAGAKKRAIPNEAALAIRMDTYGMLEDEGTILVKAWESLEGKNIRECPTFKQILAKVEADLLDFEGRPHEDSKSRRIQVSRIIEFLKKGGKKGGKAFVGFDEDGNSRRQSWKVFRNAFAAWFFDLSQSSTIQEYLERAGKQEVLTGEMYQRTFSLPQTKTSSVLYYLFVSQLVMAREPVIVHEAEVRNKGIAKAIEDALSNTAEE